MMNIEETVHRLESVTARRMIDDKVEYIAIDDAIAIVRKELK